jgi:NAD(P)-dependent dehydrogenase (short-subunit alcohol dehydrogenase family)
MQGIKDKVVVITGASSGIGEATAVMLAERGAKVVLGARIGSAGGSRSSDRGTRWRGRICGLAPIFYLVRPKPIC